MSKILTTRQYFQTIAAGYGQDARRRGQMRDVISAVNNLRSGPQINKTALDCGISIGIQWADLGWNVTGVDLSPAMLGQCRQNGITEDLHCIDIADENLEWPGENNSYGLVTCDRTLYFIRDAAEIVKKLIAKAAPNNFIFFNFIASEGGEILEDSYTHKSGHMVKTFVHPHQSIIDAVEQVGARLRFEMPIETESQHKAYAFLVEKIDATPS